MKTIVSISIATALGLATIQPAFAEEHEKEHAKSRPQAAHGPAGKQAAVAPRGVGRNAAPRNGPAVQNSRSLAQAPGAPARAARSEPGRNAAVVQSGRPGVASVGANAGRNQSFERAPQNISGGWNHGRQYEWNHHHYGWRGNDWVIIDVGYPGYGGYGGYGYPGGGYGSGGMTASVQSSLDRQGYNAGPPDGVMGGQTRDAIAAFQGAHGLQQTGMIDPPLVSALGLQ